jgi:hypothetical protein
MQPQLNETPRCKPSGIYIDVIAPADSLSSLSTRLDERNGAESSIYILRCKPLIPVPMIWGNGPEA